MWREPNLKATKVTLLRRVTGLCPNAALMLTILFLIVVATTAAAQTAVFVPGNASGCFGNADLGCPVPLVAALTVSGPATITVTYVSGTVVWEANGEPTGPDGARANFNGWQSPLQEAHGIAGGWIPNLAALIGVFVPQSRVQDAGFSALDGTKGVTPVGIMPNGLFFIGTGKTFSVNVAGTLYLGINDPGVNDNSGGFNVTVTGS